MNLMDWFKGDVPVLSPTSSRTVNKPRSRVGALKHEIALLEAEDAFVAKKAAGTLTKQDRLDIREQRKEYRLKYRKPVQPGEGAAPAPIVVPTEVNEVG